MCENECLWINECRTLDENYKTQRIFYCLKTISESHKNNHWKKRATYKITPHIDRWDKIDFSLSFSNPLFRIDKLRELCPKRDNFDNIAVPFLAFQKPLHYLKKQSLTTSESEINFKLPSRFESSFAYALILSKEVKFLSRVIEKSIQFNIDKNDIYTYIASQLSSIKSGYEYNLCASQSIKNILKDYTHDNLKLNIRDIGILNGLINKYDDFNLDLMNKELDKLYDTKYKIDNYSLNLFLSINQRFKDSLESQEVSMYPMHALRNYLHYKNDFFPDLNKKSDISNINTFVIISNLYIEELQKSIYKFQKLTSIYSTQSLLDLAIEEAINLQFYLDMCENSFSGLVPIPQDLDDGNIEVSVLSKSNLDYKTPFGFEEKFEQWFYNNIMENKVYNFFTILKYMILINFEKVLYSLLSKTVLKYFLLNLEFQYYVSLESAESVNIKLEVEDIGYRIKEPKKLKDFFNRYKYEDNYVHVSTRKKTCNAPYFNKKTNTLTDYGNALYPIEIRYQLARGLNFFLLLIFVTSLIPLFINGDMINYLFSGIVPIFVLLLTTFSLGSWSLTHRLVKTYKYLFSLITILIILKILFIIIGKNFPDIMNNSFVDKFYRIGKSIFYRKI